MRERINRLSKGIIEMDVPALTVRPSAIEEEIKAGEKNRGELIVTSDNKIHSKGLIYSSNPRVTVANSSFGGGIQSHIGYEINSRYLEYGEIIEGAFYLVTNGGEKEIPYSFRVEAGNSGKILSQLKEPKDFAALARRDYDLALRLFGFRDFTEVPFMKDLDIRTVYDGLHGQGNRFGQLEQFFIALGVKEPVKLHISQLKKEYYGADQIIQDVVEIQKEGWGYLPITIKVEGEFIQSLNKTVADEDFHDGRYEFPYEINPAVLHGGRNYGSITVETIYDCIKVEIQVHGLPTNRERTESKRYSRYLSMRLEYEAKKEKKESLGKQMAEELEQLRMSGGSSVLLSLTQAELMAVLGRKEEARRYLAECKEQVYDRRMENPDWFCLYEYASALTDSDQERKESLRRLLGKYVEEGKADYLLFYLYTMCDENWCFENPGEVLSQLKVLFGEGCRSPFLYQQALEMWNQMPQLLYGIGTMELQALNYGAKRKLVGEELAVKTAKLSGILKQYQPLCCKMLKALYREHPKKEILEAVCSLMIRGECRKESDFVWYEKAVREQLSLTRLYEYFLYSLPGKDYKQLIPKQVLLYFSYEQDLERESREVLYENMIQYLNTETALYQEFERTISRFAVEQALESRINRRLAVIYEEMIYPDMIDSSLARVLPSILRSYRISCKNPQMKYVVVCYKELTEEAVYPLTDGIAYVPIFSKEVEILFQDAYGNRYTKISHIKTRILDKPELEQRCFELDPDQPMLLLAACKEAVASEVVEEKDKKVMEQALSQLPLHPLYRKMLTGRLIRHYQSHKEEEARSLPLLATDTELLSKELRSSLCETLIDRGLIKDAYDMVSRYRCQISKESLKKLCSHMILEKIPDQNHLLLSMAYEIYEEKMADGEILDYLCRFFNGTSSQMYGVLLKGVKDQAETYDMEERLLGQMMFTGEISHIDQVFAFYITRKKAGEIMIKAYFTIKSAEYFLHDVPAAKQVFAHLENLLIHAIEKERMPTIYLLALSRYYSQQPQLGEEQRQLCQTIVDYLLDEGLVFPYLKQLAGQIRIPEEILNKAMIQYVGQKGSKVELKVRILPNEERFHREEIRRVYQGIFVSQVVLFEGEIMEYEIYEQQGDEKILMKEGSVACELRDSKDPNSRFGLLNQMSLCLNLKEEEGLCGAMEEYMKKNAVVEQLFELM